MNQYWAFIHSNARRLHDMKIVLLLFILVVRGPLLCEENSLLGYRLDCNNSRGKETYLEGLKKKRFSLSIHPIHTKPIDGFFIDSGLSFVPILHSLICKNLLAILVSFFSELFNFGRSPETRAIIYALVCVLCVLHVIIPCLKWRNKQNCVCPGQFNNDLINSLRHDSRGKYGLT